jgi:hypothetical protein
VAIASTLVASVSLAAVTLQQAAIISATLSSLTPGDSSPDRPIVLEMATSGSYALTRWSWGFASGDALLARANGAWHVIDTTAGSFDAGALEKYDRIPNSVAVALVDRANRVTVASEPPTAIADRLAGKLGCGYAYATYYRMNFPPGTTSSATEIAHAKVLMYRDDGISWLLLTRNGSMFYADGPINAPSHVRAPQDLAVAILRLLAQTFTPSSTFQPQDGALYPAVSHPDFASLRGLGVDVRDCF